MTEPWKPHAGQKRMVKFLIENNAAALFADPGLGKTSTVYAAFSFLKKHDIAKRMLVIAPLRPAQLVWPAEQQKWKDFAHLKVVVLHGKDKDALLHSDADVCVTNPESLDWLLDARKDNSGAGGKVRVTCDLKAFRRLGFDTLVLDELTLWKRTSTVRFKSLKAVRPTFARAWGLTGTPIPNGLLDLFGQCLILDMGRAFGPYVTGYRRQFFVPDYTGWNWRLQEGAEERIYDRLRPLALRLAAEDYVDMPDLVENVVRFDLPPEARKIYKELEDEFIAEVEGGTIVASNAAAASTKLRQCTNGAVYTSDPSDAGPRRWSHVHDGKLDLLTELVEGLQGTPLLCFYDFEHDLQRILKRFGKDTPNIGSGVGARRATEIERAWNAGEVPLLLGHPMSIGHGLNLQGSGNHVAWFGLPWARDLLDQGNGRVRRQGSRHQTVFAHYLVARGTIDEAVVGALRSKEKVQTALLRALRERRRGR